MTVGEKIQKHRKQLGLSQEELGQKLLVSRQTISLWEKDQTVPTIDNLIRLSSIFGTTVDEILDTENKEQDNKIQPHEAYRFVYTKDELEEIRKQQIKSFCKKPVIFALCCIIMIISLIESSAPDLIIGIVAGIFFVCTFFYIKGIFTYNKNWKNSAERISKSTYEYSVFEDYIDITIYRENETVRATKCFFTDIEKIQQFDNWLFLFFNGQIYIVRKSDLKENSAFYSYMYKNPSKTTKKPTDNKWKRLSVILFVASFMSLTCAMVLVTAVTGEAKVFLEYMWLFFLLTPIPIASVIFGFILKSKGYKYKKNIVIGIIMTALLCIYGSFTFIFENTYDHSDTPIIRAEQLTGIDIPEHKQINTQDWTQGTQSVSRGYIYSTSDIYFDDQAVEEFEKQLKSDDKWLNYVPNDMIGITSSFSDHGTYDFILIYNADTAEYNTLPGNSGTFSFINILYRTEDNQMRIVEYDIDYVK